MPPSRFCILALALAACGPTSPPPATAPPAAEPTPAAEPPAVAQAPSEEEPEEEPEEIPVSINARYTEQTDAKAWVERFEREGREVHDRRDQIIAALELKPGMVVADVGAGTGLFTFELAKAVGPEGRVFAVDVQDYFLSHLREQVAKKGVQNVEPLEASKRGVGLEPGSVDLIFMCDTFHHIEYPKQYLASLRDALRQGGQFALIDYRNEEGVEDWLREHVRESPAGFREEVETAGFEFVRAPKVLEENFFFLFKRR